MTGQLEPVFDQSSAAREIYWLRDGSRRAGFRASGAVSFGASVTLTQSWTDNMGLWFWLDAAPSDDAKFAAELAAYLNLLPPSRGPRAIWLSGVAGDGVSDWRSNVIAMERVDGHTVVVSGDTFEVNGVRVMISAQNTVTLGEYEGDFQGWGFSLEGDPGLVFSTGSGVLDAALGQSGFGYGVGQIGCVFWTLDLEPAGDDGPADLTLTGASLRFFAPDPSWVDSVRVLRVDALRQIAPLTLFCLFDPMAPLDAARTRLALLPFNAVAKQTPSLQTGYVTARGYEVALAPRNSASATPPGFVFAVQPLTTGGLDGPVVYYLTPDGDFDLTPTNLEGSPVTVAAPGRESAAPVDRLLCGATGLEYLGLASSTDAVLSFRAGNAAFAPPNIEATTGRVRAAPEGEGAPPALTTLGTTAWCWLAGKETPSYYAEPEDAPFYKGGAAGFLDYLEIGAVTLTSPERAPAFPMVGYAGLDAAQTDFASEIEARGIAPERRRQIGLLTSAQWLPATRSGAPLTLPDAVPAVSPPGLAIGYAGDEAPWAWLAIGNTGTSSDGLPDLRFTAVDGAFRQAILTNRLFMVLGDATAVMASGSVAYQLTPASLGLIGALPVQEGVPAEVLEAVSTAVEDKDYPVYPTEPAFNAMLTGAVPAITPGQMLVFQRFAGLLSPAIGDWLFRMSPRNWAAPEREGPKNARLIFKFVGERTLADLVADTSAWSWPEASSEDGSAATARDDIQAIIRAAREADANAKAKKLASPYEKFLRVVDDRNWTGVLALSIEAPLDSLPEPVQPLAAGINPGSFYAHHLGLTATTFTSEVDAIQFDITSSFGLIDYQNPIDQYFSGDIAFAFRVQQLTVGFENGKLSSFTSTAQLMVNRLFGAETRLFPTEHGNNIILDGVYQTERGDSGGERGTYVFAMRGAGAFQLALGALEEVAVDQMRMVTARAADPASGHVTVTAAFQMVGRLKFAGPENFDPFCWGAPAPPPPTDLSLFRDEAAEEEAAGSAGLAYSNYAITMSFSLSDPAKVLFSVAEANIAVDTANSPPRENSLFARFPLRLTGLMTTPDPKLTGQEPAAGDPQSAGFVSVSAPLQQGKLTQPWYGLVYEVDLGTLGALAGSVGVTVRLLAAWSPAGGKEGSPAVYFGVALPGVEKMLGVSLPLQGILDIGFRTIQFSTYNDKKGRRQYLMRMRDFGLHVLGLSFPPGHNDISIFGNPNQTSNTKLGWYAAYDNGEGKDDARSTERISARAAARPRRKGLAVPDAARLIRAARPARLDRTES